MEGAKTIACLMFRGVKDCIYGIVIACWYLRKDTKNDPTRSVVKQKREKEKRGNPLNVLMQCMMFGILFCAANWLFNCCILGLCARFKESFLNSDEIEAISWLPTLLSIVFFCTWILPLFFISRILNYSWYQEIADLTYENTRVKKGTPFSFTYSLSDQTLSALIQIIFLGQGYVVYLLPIPTLLKHFLSNLHMSLLYSLYAFEYKWVHMRWPIRKRLSYVDAKWPYFVGFGLPLAIVTSCANSYINSVCIFSTFFPVYVVSSTVTFDNEVQKYSQPLRSFSAADYLANLFFVYLNKFFIPR